MLVDSKIASNGEAQKHTMNELTLTGARLVLPGETYDDTIHVMDVSIDGISPGKSVSAIDLEGRYLTPGLVYLHAGNLEKHALSRPGITWNWNRAGADRC
ncbi:hypothetical protein C7U60_15250 [Mesorhizobium plurifarium]|uniref:hypothetical protein n=1 Tax=Sinorhizobium arboris TaxID=76745 RepID=UPI00040D5BC5|nr:hypothetical protein [Sinorhizobium arboris]PST20769.1 hypothetical protein C7U60_15250 [Mesorhizobium plurifarium]